GGIGVRENDVGLEPAAIEQPYASGPAVGDVDFGYLGVGGDFDPVFPVKCGEGVGDGAHAATDEAPGALMPVDVADQVVILDVSRAGRTWPGVDPDHAAGAEG